MSQTDGEERLSSSGISCVPGDRPGSAASCPCRSHWKLGVLVLVAIAAAMVLAAKYRGAPAPQAGSLAAQSAPGAATAAQAGLPRLLELGSVSCIPCQMMAPVLDQLRREHAGKLQVDFVDVREHQEAIQAYLMRAMPTQVFFDASGKEVFRHEGFFPKDDILAKWKELGVDLSAGGPDASGHVQPVEPE
jgi:thioredoxin 1